MDRTFRELSKHTVDTDVFDPEVDIPMGAALGWPDLLNEHRVVILAEAGAGKTEEIRAVAVDLRRQGKAAFFVRLEDIPNDLELAFEVGTFEAFRSWQEGTAEGWLLLDSVDEARLRSPSDFAVAIRRIARAVAGARDRVHVVITSRAAAWRPRSDLAFVEQHLPRASTSLVEVVDDLTEAGSVRTGTKGGADDTTPAFKVVGLDDLTPRQMTTYLAARGIDATAFMAAVERADALSFTSRPQDLEELADFWRDERRIGTRLELMRASIDRRLTERDQNRAVARPLALTRAREGARLLAAATTLAKQPLIRVPDGADNSPGIPIAPILPGWNEADQEALLARPMFDEANYGTVRFHHRSAREYLVAEWLADLLRRGGSRREIEALIFRRQYDFEVVALTLRPVLPWLAILDDKVRARVLEIAPDIALEGGDPSAFPVEDRRRMLRDVCARIAAGTERRPVQDLTSVRRFADADLTADVRSLIGAFIGNDDVVAFLMRMIWLGELSGALPEARAIAGAAGAEEYRRRTAIRAVRAVGTDDDFRELRRSFLNEAEVPDRGLLAELVEGLRPDEESIAWLLSCLRKTQARQPYAVDDAGEQVAHFAERASVSVLPNLVDGLATLLNSRPVHEEDDEQADEKQFAWLLVPAATAVQRLVVARSAASLNTSSLSIMRRLGIARRMGTDELHGDHTTFEKLVPAWPELNRALFWISVAMSRAALAEKGKRLTNELRVSLGAFWRFDVLDFDYLVLQIAEQNELDDKLVALSVALRLYRDNNRPRQWRARLHQAATLPELASALQLFLRPPPSTDRRRFSEQQRQWKARKRARDQRRVDDLAASKRYFSDHIEELRAAASSDPASIGRMRAMSYLRSRLLEMRDAPSRWGGAAWRDLAPTFGSEVARFYRDSAVLFWRHHRPTLHSEGFAMNQTATDTIIGLAGLEIEAAENTDWFQTLSVSEVESACRHAAFELNGFPAWFPTLFAAFPAQCGEFLMQEVRFELSIEKAEAEINYILSDVAWSGEWAWEALAPAVLIHLRGSEPTNLGNLSKLLKILQGSSVSDEELSDLAKSKCLMAGNHQHHGKWFAVWVGTAPDEAIPHLEEHLSSLDDPAAREQLTMTFATSLFAVRDRDADGVRTAFDVPATLGRLYRLIMHHVPMANDIDRAGSGFYRDDAQRARDSVLERLRKTPGKEAFLALDALAKAQPGRPWLARLAYERAEVDGDLSAFTVEGVRDLHDTQTRTPADHRQLAELAVRQFVDLKEDIEEGDSSIAALLGGVREEVDMRKYIGRELRHSARGRYTIPQEEEFADGRKPDLRFHGVGFDAPVPVELKLADRWTGPKLFERLENQLIGDYLRDPRSRRGIFVLVHSGKPETRWTEPAGSLVTFDTLVEELNRFWRVRSYQFPAVDEITVIGIDLAKRFT